MNFLIVQNKVIYTGPIDEYFDYCFGKLEYRSLKFEEEILDIPNYQGMLSLTILRLKFLIPGS